MEWANRRALKGMPRSHSLWFLITSSQSTGMKCAEAQNFSSGSYHAQTRAQPLETSPYCECSGPTPRETVRTPKLRKHYRTSILWLLDSL